MQELRYCFYLAEQERKGGLSPHASPLALPSGMLHMGIPLVSLLDKPLDKGVSYLIKLTPITPFLISLTPSRQILLV